MEQKSYNLREIILDSLLEMAKTKEYSHLVVKNVLDKYNYLEGQEKAFLKRVLEGTIERQMELDYRINCYSKISVSKMKPLIRELLRMSVYQLLYMDQVPDSAVCNEAVKLAGKRKFVQLKGYVNGVLRSIAKEKDKECLPDKEKEPVLYDSVKYSMPMWLVEMWHQSYGMETTEKMMQSFLEPKPVTIHFKDSLSEEAIQEALKEMETQGVVFRQYQNHPRVFFLEKAEGIAGLFGYKEGMFYVQDASSILAIEAAGIKQGDYVLDICAAPGGKTMAASFQVGKDGMVEARDLSDYKVSMIEENLKRMQIENVNVTVWDAREMDDELLEKADVVLADVPCSGLGIIGKKQDIKYRITQESLKEVEELQREIISTSLSYVKRDGIFFYSTCTIQPGENQQMAEWILEKTGWKLEESRQFLPGIDETDGFFYARFRNTNGVTDGKRNTE